MHAARRCCLLDLQRAGQTYCTHCSSYVGPPNCMYAAFLQQAVHCTEACDQTQSSAPSSASLVRCGHGCLRFLGFGHGCLLMSMVEWMHLHIINNTSMLQQVHCCSGCAVTYGSGLLVTLCTSMTWLSATQSSRTFLISRRGDCCAAMNAL